MAGVIHKNRADFRWLPMGAVATVQLAPVPILDAKGQGLGSLGNRLFEFNGIGKEMFTTEVSTAIAVNANGEYHIDYTTGLFTGQPATAGYAKVWWQSESELVA
jgi:hypothetical protein